MSALVLCGNSGVILLSVKDHQHIDSAIPGRYTVQAPYKAGVGIGVLELHTATIGALASFLLLQLSYTQIMVGWVGAPKGAPVSVCAGYANPAQFTTSEIGVSGGGSYPLHTEAAIMATVPALSRLNDEDLHKLSYVTTALRALRKVTLSDPQAHQVLVETLLNLQAERIRLADKANFHIHRLLNIRGGHRHA
nr:ash family protein [Escherichia coli]